MRVMTYAEALREAMRNELKRDPRVFIMGEDVGRFGGCFGVTGNLVEEFGEDRVRDTPISEEAIAGAAIGAAATGMRPVAEIMFIDFVTVAMDQLVNQAAKMRYMFGGNISLPMVVRLPEGGGIQAAAQHSQCLEAWLTHVPGIKVVYPSDPQDALGLLISSIRDDNPVAFIEHKMLYSVKGEVSDENEPIPLGLAAVKRKGEDATVIATGYMVSKALKAAEELAKDGIEIEVIDPRTLFPLDKETIYGSIKKTHKVVIVTEEAKRGGWGGELAAQIAEEVFDYLDAQIVRIGALNTPIPFAKNLESYCIPSEVDIVNAVKSIL
ncbi:MAG: acetoin:2,6-dichlorophenolindophenol oxidoreductase subunit beta [Tepidanaerobacteraceae bacterium]|jgi:pyruvate dehydrogenase E1 component beta subunit|nr:acetoin:2,6-dichlorophenolindophenol oxidoreductase subunit beta [Tepidanaerobacteraceae bacterium]MDK2877382.1 acetoin:2,6-dichlorophenolindophenol oxidoreductase subunit beta [Thermoanaerobacteraceae bacterium]MDN5312140.1 acetoin:2,6-dichlorophenolindophenol oxidoreductase subunit beta [Thermoanaerobacteraceae bacterium]RKL63844.1 alpha-ketoacid dehydrogenase subunit beta [Thermoanaerobacteraceae bacterium SP2]